MYQVLYVGLICHFINLETKLIKVPTRITPKHEKSPFYVGTKLWDELPIKIQGANSVHEFKREIDKLYRTYKNLL